MVANAQAHPASWSTILSGFRRASCTAPLLMVDPSSATPWQTEPADLDVRHGEGIPGTADVAVP